MNILIEIWMTLISLLFIFGNVPQMIQIIKSKSSKGIKYSPWLIYIFCQIQYVFYGVYKSSFAIVFSNSFCIITNLILIFIIKKYQIKKNY